MFDFDGTLADTMKMVRFLGDEIFRTLGRKPLSETDIEKMRKMTVPQSFRYLKVPLYRLPQLMLQARNLMKEQIDDLQPIEGIEPVLASLRKEGYQLAIVTSNSAENVTAFLKKQNLLGHFDFIEAGAGAFNKAHKLKQTMKRHELDATDCIYVGDEIRDIQAAHQVKMPVIGVSWGVNHADSLAEYKPNAIVYTPKELHKQIGALS